MIRASAVLVTVVFTGLLGAAWWAGEKPVPAVEPPETTGTPVLLAEGPDRPRDAARPGPRSEALIGTFEAPEEVPAYKVLDVQRDGRDGARAARLLVDTRSRSQGDFVQITRHIKARYSGLDAVSVEFIDLTGRYGYHGGALIFNTVAGATYIGYIYGPPNNRGYYVSATD